MKQELIPEVILQWCPTCDVWCLAPHADHPEPEEIEEDDDTSDDGSWEFAPSGPF